MKYRLELLTNIGPLTVSTVLFSPDVVIDSWSKRINAPGKMVFSIRATNPKATEANLRPYRRVRLYRQTDSGYVVCWFGYIEDKAEFDGRIEVICAGMLNFFTKRLTANDEAFAGQGSAEAFGLLADCNTDDDTGVTAGTGGVTTTKDIETQGRIDVFTAWTKLAQAHAAEFEINDDGEFNFMSSVGNDLSASVTLVFRRDGSPGSNVSSIRIAESGRDMATRIVATSSAPGVSEYIYDSPNQSTYGVIVEQKSFNEAQDDPTLEAMADAYGSQREHPIPDFQVTPESARLVLNQLTGQRVERGLDYFDVSIGDLVSTQIITENLSVTTAKRIAEIVVNVDANGKETMSFTLTEAGVFVTAGYLEASRVDELIRKVAYIETVL